MAAAREISPASTTPAMISANLRTFPLPTQPSRRRHSSCVPSPVPPPKVATISDGIVIETMSDLEEADIAIEAARATGLPVVACMVYDTGKNDDRTLMGVTPEQAAEALARSGADVIGANCGSGVAGYVPICRRLAGATDLPIWIKPNAGIPEIVAGQVVYRTTPEEFAATPNTMG